MRQLTTTVKAALACAAPLLACSTYYTVERLGEASPIVFYAALAALPTLTVSLAAAVVALASDRRGGLLLGAAALASHCLAFYWQWSGSDKKAPKHRSLRSSSLRQLTPQQWWPRPLREPGRAR